MMGIGGDRRVAVVVVRERPPGSEETNADFELMVWRGRSEDRYRRG